MKVEKSIKARADVTFIQLTPLQVEISQVNISANLQNDAEYVRWCIYEAVLVDGKEVENGGDDPETG